MIHKILKPILKRRISLFLLVISFSISGCASHKKINRLAGEIECDKTILFEWDEAGNSVLIDRKGHFAGNSVYPDYRKKFRESIEELKKNRRSQTLRRD